MRTGMVCFVVSWMLGGCGLLLELAPPGADGGPSTFDAALVDAGRADGGFDAASPTRCGDGVLDPGEACDDGNGVDGDGCDDDCAFTCVDDGQCAGSDACTIDRCSETHVCVTEVAPCAVPDACHAAMGCEPTSGCLFALIDGDGDGHASAALGVCGTDCHDGDDTVFPGAVEECDGLDQDCDGSIDEGSGLLCGQDLDGDRFGSVSVTVVACVGETCPVGFVEDATDCWDSTETELPPPGIAHPGQVVWFGEPRRDGTGSYDWSCDGIDEQRDTQLFVSCDSSAGPCEGQSGWGVAGPAACGATAEYIGCLNAAGGGCAPSRVTRRQVCR